MSLICVYVEITEEFLEIYEEITEKVPCWTDLGIDDNYIAIKARDEDIPWIEKMLSPFV